MLQYFLAGNAGNAGECGAVEPLLVRGVLKAVMGALLRIGSGLVIVGREDLQKARSGSGSGLDGAGSVLAGSFSSAESASLRPSCFLEHIGLEEAGYCSSALYSVVPRWIASVFHL